MDMTRIAPILILVACAPTNPNITATASAVTHREQFQALIDEKCAQPDGGTVFVPAGRWQIERAPLGTRNRFSGLSFGPGCESVALVGADSASVLEPSGDLGGSAMWLVSVDPGAIGTGISGLFFDGRGAVNTGEQVHAISSSGVCEDAGCMPIDGLNIHHNRFNWPYTGETRNGDCIRLLGNSPETALFGARIADNDFTECARSAVGINGVIDGLRIVDNDMRCSECDSLIDFEGTGGRRARNAVVTGNTMKAGPGAQGPWDAVLSRSDNVTFANNTLSRGLQVFGVTGASITGNTIEVAAVGGEAAVEIRNECDGVTMTGNTIKRTGVAGPVLHMYPHTNVCSGASVGVNSLTQGTNSPAVIAEAVSGLSLTGVQIAYTVAAPSKAAIHIKSTRAANPVNAVSINGVTITGSPTYAITLEAFPGTFGAGLNIGGNTSTGTMFGLRCDEPANFTAPITSSGNSIGPRSCLVPVVFGD